MSTYDDNDGLVIGAVLDSLTEAHTVYAYLVENVPSYFDGHPFVMPVEADGWAVGVATLHAATAMWACDAMESMCADANLNFEPAPEVTAALLEIYELAQAA